MVSGSNGILSKFQQRLRNIRLARLKKKKQNEEFILEKTKEIHRLAPQQTSKKKGGPNKVDNDNQNDKKVVNDVSKENVVQGNKEINSVDAVSLKEKDNIDNSSGQDDVIDNSYNDDKIYVGLKKDSEKEDKNDYSNDKVVTNKEEENVKLNENQYNKSKDKEHYDFNYSKNDVSVGGVNEQKEKIDAIAEDLLFRIHMGFEDCIDELDVLESEFYLLSSEEEFALTMNKIKKIKTKINEYVVKLNELIDVYNSYKKRYYIDSVADINDDVIADDLISFRMLLNSQSEEKDFIGDVKKLESFQFLYRRLNEARNEVNLLRDKANEKQINFEERDKKYKEILEKSLNASQVNKDCVEEIKKQNDYFDSLMEKVNSINKIEYVTTHLRGFNELIWTSLRYAGLLLLSPLRNTVPGIGVQMLATRRMLDNISNHIHYEEVKHVRYEAVNYENEINNNLSDVRYVSGVIDDNLDFVKNLRDDFMLHYDSKVPGYEKSLNSIDSMYNMILKNKKKINIIEEKLNRGKKMNEEKLKLVKHMNEQE